MAAKFPTTRWSLVLRAGHGEDTGARDALNALCEAYWFPLYAYARRRGYGEADARDIVQSYFVRLIDKRFLEAVRPDAGRFRAFLLHTLKHFMSNERVREAAQRRGGDREHFSLDLDDAEARFAAALRDDRTPEQDFDRNWALSVVDRVMARLRVDAGEHGRPVQFEKLQSFLTDMAPRGSYAEAARELGVSEGAVKVAVHRLRKKFGDALREEIAATVDDPREIEDEIRYLFTALTG